MLTCKIFIVYFTISIKKSKIIDYMFFYLQKQKYMIVYKKFQYTGEFFMKKIIPILLLLVLSMLFVLASCSQDSTLGDETEDITNNSDSVTEGNDTSVPDITDPNANLNPNDMSELYSYPEKDNTNFSFAALPEEYYVDDYRIQELGNIQLVDYPVDYDGVYDWGHSIIKDGDTYKMWWTRACPMDTIWYAESTDMKNWTNQQMVFKIYQNTEWIKYMLGWSDVIKVDGTYYMYFEAPATHDSQGEYNNNVFVATSTDGIHFEMYPSNENPEPVIKTPEDIAQNERRYGVGQPDAFYKDGYFYVYYTDAATGTSGSGKQFNATRVAKSKDGIHFEGTVYTHDYIIDLAGVAVRYNSVTNKFYAALSVNPNLFDKSKPDCSMIFIMESDDGINFPFDDLAAMCRLWDPVTVANSQIQRSNSDFAVNAEGIIDTPTMYLINMYGERAAAGTDHRSTHTTWDGYLTAINPSELRDNPITLPNGKVSNIVNLKAYYDLVAEWKTPTMEVPYGAPQIDGEMDECWNDAPVAHVEMVNYYGSECEPTETKGEVRLLWDEKYIYIYAVVEDDLICTTGSVATKDGVTLIFDAKNVNLESESSEIAISTSSMQISLCADGKKSGTGTVEARLTDDGYILEGAIEWKKRISESVAEGAEIAMDICIFDSNVDGKLNSKVFWSDYKGLSNKYADRMGRITLVK